MTTMSAARNSSSALAPSRVRHAGCPFRRVRGPYRGQASAVEMRDRLGVEIAADHFEPGRRLDERRNNRGGKPTRGRALPHDSGVDVEKFHGIGPSQSV
jgi:hypothetical protein